MKSKDFSVLWRVIPAVFHCDISVPTSLHKLNEKQELCEHMIFGLYSGGGINPDLKLLIQPVCCPRPQSNLNTQVFGNQRPKTDFS